MKNLSYILKVASKKIFILSFAIFFVCLVFFSFSASFLFGTQQQLTHPPVKSSTLPLRKMPVFQGVAPWHKISTSSCVILLCDLARVHSPSGQKLISSSLVESCFSGLIVVLCNVLSCLGPLWFGTHPYYSLNPYIHLHYLWSISIAKDRRYPK